MNRLLLFLTCLYTLMGCASSSIHSNQEPGAVPQFSSVLVVVKQKEKAQRHADEYRFAFPPGYQVSTLGLDDLTFGVPDSLIRRQATAEGSQAVLWLEVRPSGSMTGGRYYASTDYEMYGEMRTWPDNRAFWKGRALLPSLRGSYAPSTVVHRLMRDGILQKTGPALSAAALSPKTP